MLYDRLDALLKARLADLGRNPDFYGVALDHTTGSTKALDRESALLLLTMRTPGALPRYALRILGADARRTITGYVLDNVLQIEIDGAFVSGSRAAEAVAPAVDPNGVDTLSMAALRAGAALAIDDAAVLARRLYAYNSLPRTPHHRWSGTDTWVSWSGRAASAPIGRSFKLYVSPAVDDVPAAVEAAKAAANRHGALGGKVGGGPYGLLRPDKLIVYFASYDALHRAAAELTATLAGMRAHGVPFTAALSGDGLLSWASDPPSDSSMLGWLRDESWRTWLTDRLASAMIAARAAGDDPIAFALLRVAALGVDPRNWTLAA